MVSRQFQAVLVQVGTLRLGIPLHQVVEALQMVALETLPDAPAHCLGSFNFHGAQLVVLDLAARLGVPRAEKEAHTRGMLVLQVAGGRIGLAVDRVLYMGRAELPPPEYLPTLPATQELLEGFVSIKGTLVPVINSEALVRDELRAAARTLLEASAGPVGP